MATIDIARELAKRIYVETNKTASIDLIGLLTAANAIDTAMNATTNTVATQKPGIPLKTALLQFLQDSQPDLTSQEAGIALMLWTAHEIGLL